MHLLTQTHQRANTMSNITHSHPALKHLVSKLTSDLKDCDVQIFHLRKHKYEKHFMTPKYFKTLENYQELLVSGVTCVLVREEDEVTLGISVTGATDHFEKRVGVNTALRRVVDAYTKPDAKKTCFLKRFKCDPENTYVQSLEVVEKVLQKHFHSPSISVL